MAYTYDPIFAVDPNNSENVAKNASITIFDPADPAQAPIAIQDPTGSPLPNPITADAAGMASAFQHPTLARVGWKGAGFVGYFTSYEGMYNETMAAKEAAQAAIGQAEAAASAAAGAAAEAGANAATAASSALANAVASAQAAQASAADAAALVSAPADDAIAAAVSGSGATKAALDAHGKGNYGAALVRPTGANDQSHINNAAIAATAVGGSGVVTLSEGVFAWDADISAWNKGFTLRGQGSGKTIIQLGPAALHGPRWSGSSVQVGGNNSFATTAANSKTLTLDANYTASLAPGDFIVLSSGAMFGARGYYNVAEWAVVAAITSTTLTLKWPLRHAYNTADVLRIHKYNLLAGVRLEDVTIAASPTTTNRQVLSFMRACESPAVSDVHAKGSKAEVGIDVWESITPTIDCTVEDIKDLANIAIGTWTGYGVRTAATLDAEVKVSGSRCRHVFDNSSASRLPPALRTHVSGTAYDCVSTGWSDHGGSDECFFDHISSINCGGGAIVRGRASKGRGVTVRGVTMPAADEYSALGGATQSYKMGLWVGEQIDGGTISPAGTRLDWEFLELDMAGGDNSAHAIYIRDTDLIDARLDIGNVSLVAGYGVYSRANKVRNVRVAHGTIKNPGVGRSIEFSPLVAADGNNQKDLVFEDIMFDGYANACIAVVGNAAAGVNASQRVILRRNTAKNKSAGYSADSSVWRIESGYFATIPGSVEIRDNAARESSAFGVKTDQANGATGLGAGLTAKGNANATGYDTAP
jgi:hypothetical protein